MSSAVSAETPPPALRGSAKPLIPVYRRTLIAYAFDHLIAAGAEQFMVNTHHRHERYAEAFPGGAYRGRSARLSLRADAAGDGGRDRQRGGLDRRQVGGLVYNGDILTDLPLEPLIDEHFRVANLVTLALRSDGFARHIALDPGSRQVTDIRNLLGTGQEGGYQFTGIYVIDPAFVARLTPGEVKSVIPEFLDLIREGLPIGGAVIDVGIWSDLGSRESYLDAHAVLGRTLFPSYGGGLQAQIDPTADMGANARFDAGTCVGAGAVVGPGALLDNTVVWAGGKVAPGARLNRCVVRTGQTASGDLDGADV
ncbi:MAG: hypothetical protein R3F11_09675 [Verrucomicrobiales bacterium]